MSATPKRPRAADSSGSQASPSQPNAYQQSKMTQLVQLTFSVKNDWTRWVNLKITQDSKGYTSDNVHAKAVTAALGAMRSGGRRDIILHGRFTDASKTQINEMYEHFPGWGNRIDLHAELMPAAQFVAGVDAEINGERRRRAHLPDFLRDRPSPTIHLADAISQHRQIP